MVDYKYKDLFLKGSVDKQLKIATDDGSFAATNSDINWENFQLEESLCSDSELRFGSCEASMVKFQIRNAFITLKDKWITVTETLNGKTDAPFQYGRYKVFSDVPTADKEYRDIIAYDSMYDILSADVADWYNKILPKEDSEVNMKFFRTSLLQWFGIEQAEIELANDSMIVKRTIEPEQISGKDIITAICEINGCFGHIGRDGKFHYIYLPQDIHGLYPSPELYPDHAPEYMEQAKTGHLYPQSSKGVKVGQNGTYKSAKYEDFRTEGITKLQIRQEENDIGKIWPAGEVSENDNCYIVQDNFLVYGKSDLELGEIAERLFEKIEYVIYRPFECEAAGNPCLEVGDPIRFSTKYHIVESYILSRMLKGIQALSDSYSAKGVKKYEEPVSGVAQSIIQLKGKTNKLTRTVEETRLEMENMEEGLSTKISITAKGLEAQIAETKEDIEDKDGVLTERFKSDIKITAQGLEANITAEKERATGEEIKLSTSIKAVAGNIVLKVDSNGDIASVELGADPDTGTVFKVKARNIFLTADETIDLMAGGNLNLTGKNIEITSNNFKVDKNGNVNCSNITAKNGVFSGSMTSDNGTHFAKVDNGQFTGGRSNNSPTGYIAFNTYLSESGEYGTSIGGKGLVAIYSPTFAVADWKEADESGTVWVGQSGTLKVRRRIESEGGVAVEFWEDLVFKNGIMVTAI